MGHSFGGATAAHCAFMDKRITGPVVMFDPAIFVLPNLNKQGEHLQKNLNRPVLSINSENFFKRVIEWYKNDEKLEMLF